MYNEYKDKLIASLNYYNEELSQDCLTFLQTDLKRRLSRGLPTPSPSPPSVFIWHEGTNRKETLTWQTADVLRWGEFMKQKMLFLMSLVCTVEVNGEKREPGAALASSCRFAALIKGSNRVLDVCQNRHLPDLKNKQTNKKPRFLAEIWDPINNSHIK